MKKTIVAMMVFGASVLVGLSQGVINFANFVGAINQPIFLNGTSTGISTAYTVDLLSGSSSGSLSFITSTPILGGGVFIAGTKTLNVAGGNTAFIQVRAWLTSAGSFAAAQALGATTANTWGQSTIFTIVPVDPTVTPPPTPPNMANFTSFQLNPITPVPEPSTMVLAGLGAASLLLFRRRKQA